MYGMVSLKLCLVGKDGEILRVLEKDQKIFSALDDLNENEFDKIFMVVVDFIYAIFKTKINQLINKLAGLQICGNRTYTKSLYHKYWEKQLYFRDLHNFVCY